jgi:hypothetical protein
MQQPQIQLRHITALLYSLTAIIDKGEHESCSYEVMWDGMGKGRVLEILDELYPQKIFWMKALREDQGFVHYLNTALLAITDYMDPGRKMDIRNNGVTLLMGCLYEILQWGTWVPSQDVAGL